MSRTRTHSTGLATRIRRSHAAADPRGAQVSIRSAAPADDAAIDRLAELDDHALPRGERLIGELEGRIVAAVCVVGAKPGEAFAPSEWEQRQLRLSRGETAADGTP